MRGKGIRNIAMAAILLLSGCATTREWVGATDRGRVVEEAILWEAELDDAWTPAEMRELVADSAAFEKRGNFYKVTGPLAVFGHPAAYVGMLGVDLYAGPNAVLKGSPASVAACIADRHGVKFRRSGSAYACELKKDVMLLVDEHPGMRGHSIVIGAYTGP